MPHSHIQVKLALDPESCHVPQTPDSGSGREAPFSADQSGLPEVSQLMPLCDFPPFRPRNVLKPRLLTPDESRELALREVVRTNRKRRCDLYLATIRLASKRKWRRFVLALATVAAVLCLPTIERFVLNTVDRTKEASVVASVAPDC